MTQYDSMSTTTWLPVTSAMIAPKQSQTRMKQTMIDYRHCLGLRPLWLGSWKMMGLFQRKGGCARINSDKYIPSKSSNMFRWAGRILQCSLVDWFKQCKQWISLDSRDCVQDRLSCFTWSYSQTGRVVASEVSSMGALRFSASPRFGPN
jgi:hypothetical protein